MQAAQRLKANMDGVQEIAKKFKAVQDDYESLRQRVGLETLKQIQEDAAKAFVIRHLEECVDACKGQEGFFADAVRSQFHTLQSSMR